MVDRSNPFHNSETPLYRTMASYWNDPNLPNMMPGGYNPNHQEDAPPVVFGENMNLSNNQNNTWQQRDRNQNFPNAPTTYQWNEQQLPPPIPPIQPAERIRLTPFDPVNIRVPTSIAGDSVQVPPDLESQTPGGAQQNALDMAVLMANIQSLSHGLQEVMEQNKRLTLQMQGLVNTHQEESSTKGVKRQLHTPEKEDPHTSSVTRPLFLSPKEPEKNSKTSESIPHVNPNDSDHGGKGKTEVRKDLTGFDTDEDLKDIDKKDVALPGKYKGDAGQWRHWYTKFHTFLSRRDKRWGKLLETIKGNSQKPYEDKDEDAIFEKAEVNHERLRNKFKDQLYEYLETYTDGLTHSMVTAGGTGGSLEVFRQLCDEGFSGRERHLRKEYRRITHPKQSSFENLKKAILDWEQELAQYQAASGKELGEKERILCLEDLCPDLLQQHLDNKDGLENYGQVKAAIFDYLVNRTRWMATGKAKLNWLGMPEVEGDHDPESVEDWNQQLNNLDWTQSAADIAGSINALVKNKFSQKGRGKNGKGGGRDARPPASPDQPPAASPADVEMRNASKVCYECNEPGHIGADCPIRKARIAAGGPARLPKTPKGGGKGGKGGKGGWPTKQQWGQYYPGPSQAQWTSWFPQFPGKGNANAVQTGDPSQAPSVLQALFAGPQQLSSITQGRPKTSFESKNSFSALAVAEQEEQPPDVPALPTLADFVRPTRRRPQGAKQKTTFANAACCGGSCTKPHPESGCIARPTDEPATGETPKAVEMIELSEYLNFAKTSVESILTGKDDENKIKMGGINMFNKVMRTGNLMPFTQKQEVSTKLGKFEVMSCIVDSGATVPVMDPATGAAYEMTESAASKEGVLYELANNDTLPNLGEKKMAVLTAEGTLRGYGSQCADVAKALQSVRALVSSKHAVCYGLGDGTDHVIINKETGEVNRMRDDGINYLQDLLIIPPDKVEEVAAELNAMRQANNGQPFGRPGP